MDNIGCVIYTETKNGITAEWVFSQNEVITRGTGIGIRLKGSKPNKRFEGEYEIVYSEINGKKYPKLKLVISCASGYYTLKWINKNNTTDIGIGIENDNKLSVGWIKINEDLSS
jgi:hypothetical protein